MARRSLLVTLVALAFWGLVGLSVSAQAPEVQVITNEVGYTFSEALYFDLEIAAESPVERVVLFHGHVGEPIVRRIYPEHDQGSDIEITFTEELMPGQIAPGTTLRTWWRFEFSDGSAYETPEQRLVYDDDTQTWRELTGDDVTVRWYGRGESRARQVMETALLALERIDEELGVETTEPVIIYVYNSARDMGPALQQRASGYDDYVRTLGVAVSHDTLLLLGDDSNYLGTLAHELTHLVVHQATDNPYAGVPRWLDEGLAMYAEEGLPPDNQRALDEGIRNNELLSIQSMSSYSGNADEVDLYYGEVYAVVDFVLNEYGRESLQELLAIFAEGARQEDALQEVLGVGLQELDALWRESLGLPPRSLPSGAQGLPLPTYADCGLIWALS